MENVGPLAGLPKRWPLTRGAPFDVSGGQVTLTVSSYAVMSVIFSLSLEPGHNSPDLAQWKLCTPYIPQESKTSLWEERRPH